MNGEPEEENLNKSEISQVFEIALKRNLPVNFEVMYKCICYKPCIHILYIKSVIIRCLTEPSCLSSSIMKHKSLSTC